MTKSSFKCFLGHFMIPRVDINCILIWFEILNNECLWKSWVMNLSRVMNRSKGSSRAIILSIRLHFVIRDVKINFFVYPILTKQYNFHQCWPVFTLTDNWKRCREIIHWNKRGFMSKRTNSKKTQQNWQKTIFNGQMYSLSPKIDAF